MIIMRNLYHGNNPPITKPEELLGREEFLLELEDHVSNRRSVVVMGVEGIGKSSLLNCYFNRKYREKKAVEQNLLIRVTDFPTDRDADGIYQYLAEGVLQSLDSLDQPETIDVYRKLKEKCCSRMNESQDSASRFQQICEIIYDYDYYIMLVIDGFERFVSSPNVKMEHHDLMNTLISKNLIFVVATNFDFTKDSLPAIVSGSFLLMKFSGNEVRLKGLSEATCAKLLEQGNFTPDEVNKVWGLSGGIPQLLRRTSEHAYAYKATGQIDWRDVAQKTYADVSYLFERWCKLLSANQVRVINELLAQEKGGAMTFTDEALVIAAEQLVNRGILTNPIEDGTYRVLTGIYQFATPFLKRYCKEHPLAAETITEFQVKEAEKDWKTAVENENDVQKIMELYQMVAMLKGLPMPVDFNESISDEELQEFEISRELYNRFSRKVKDNIKMGIRLEKSLRHVELEDSSNKYLHFAKAIEIHLNLTLVPCMKKLQPEHILLINQKKIKLKDYSRSLMLGQIAKILSYEYKESGQTFAQNIGQKCLNTFNKYPVSWWESLRDDMKFIADTRNEIPHTSTLEEAQGENFLSRLFNCNNGVSLRCQDLYDAAVKHYLLP